MENVIKNIHLLKGWVPDTIIDQFEERALQYRKFARITFKILSVFRNTITIETKQDKSPAENYLGQKDLFERGQDVFKELYDNSDLKVHMNVHRYVESPTDTVTPEYIRAKMTALKIKQKHIVESLGLDAPAVSSWVSGNREMSNPVKAMFYLYFKLCETKTMASHENYHNTVREAQKESKKGSL